jgi:hypothetical protein
MRPPIHLAADAMRSCGPIGSLPSLRYKTTWLAGRDRV